MMCFDLALVCYSLNFEVKKFINSMLKLEIQLESHFIFGKTYQYWIERTYHLHAKSKD